MPVPKVAQIFKKVAPPTTTFFLLRHAHSTANENSILAGQDNSIGLSGIGDAQAQSLVEILTSLEISMVITSPLLRCKETIAPFIASQSKLVARQDTGIIEMNYGDWSGKKLSRLSKQPLWRRIQGNPAGVRFPDGESFLEMLSRSSQSIENLRGSGERVLVVSHGDVIKVLITHFLGAPLNTFQKLSIDPASISILKFSGDSFNLVSANATHHLPKIAKKSGKGRNGFILGGGSGGSA